MRLRQVEPADIPVFYEHQADPESARMVAFASRDREAHAAHLERITADPDVVLRTIVEGDAVAGQVLSFPRNGVREVGYWLGREFWGRGIATAALGEFLRIDTQPAAARRRRRDTMRRAGACSSAMASSSRAGSSPTRTCRPSSRFRCSC